MCSLQLERESEDKSGAIWTQSNQSVLPLHSARHLLARARSHASIGLVLHKQAPPTTLTLGALVCSDCWSSLLLVIRDAHRPALPIVR